MMSNVARATKNRMTRRVAFSSGHRYWFEHLSESENRALFGEWASPYNHGHNYVLDVTVEGDVDPHSGMILNIKVLDDILKARILSQFANRSMNDEIDHFRTHAPTLENILPYLRCSLTDLPAEITLTSLRLQEMPGFYADLDPITMNVTLTRTYEFAASHRLNAPALSHEQNLALYGKCNNPAGHGHNYVLEVTVTGPVDAQTGMIADLGTVDAIVHERVVDRYDHKNLNEDLPEFSDGLTSSEVVAQQIFRTLDGALPATLVRVGLWETARNLFVVERSS